MGLINIFSYSYFLVVVRNFAIFLSLLFILSYDVNILKFQDKELRN